MVAAHCFLLFYKVGRWRWERWPCLYLETRMILLILDKKFMHCCFHLYFGLCQHCMLNRVHLWFQNRHLDHSVSTDATTANFWNCQQLRGWILGSIFAICTYSFHVCSKLMPDSLLIVLSLALHSVGRWLRIQNTIHGQCVSVCFWWHSENLGFIT